MELFDSHCHIHDLEFFALDIQREVYERAVQARVAMLCVGTDQVDARAAVRFAAERDMVWAAVGVHPHEAKSGVAQIGELLSEGHERIVAIGEIGLDYYYQHSSREAQIQALEQQLQWAQDHGLPVSFHVREAYDDFWPIYDNFSGVRGVLHSFTDTQSNVDKAFDRGLYIGVNGISTFTRVPEQQQMYANLPLDRILLETDAPFLTPKPFRGKINEPKFVGRVAEHLAVLYNVPYLEVTATTTENAKRLFGIN